MARSGGYVGDVGRVMWIMSVKVDVIMQLNDLLKEIMGRPRDSKCA
jgi:hypothetical protein